VSRTSLDLKQSVEVDGTRDQHLGGRWETARIRITAKPHDCFLVTTDMLINELELVKYGYLDWAIMGLLDILLVSEAYPLRNVHIKFLEADIHPVNASQMAFRQAGRDAARKLLQVVKNNAFIPPL